MFTFKDYFHRKRILGFYFPFVAAIFSIVIGVAYFFYTYSRYYNVSVGILLLAAGISYLLLSFFRFSERYASVALYVLDLVAFFLFVRFSYLYFSEVFYGGFKFEYLFSMDPLFLLTLLGTLLCALLSNFGLYVPIRKAEKGIQVIAQEAK